ncbi:Polyribonucleotide 5'-hydroxyl-kinase Clp1 [Hypsibius exemplaris]|uniref:Polyribonucleotide 5'-hydroxyl-kinase Clp1 n=1 Tax=Hypsibius exemplaris TaxID=2072580 RepID=A0A1W0WKI6_HYPEX|nr:Polyribonucleotide 5'-hydroxyl-kinase Clp1 [Hypsibius exemplaris]
MTEEDPVLTPEPDVYGPYGKLPNLARDLKIGKEDAHVINALEELRFEVETNQVHIWMSKGQAEIFGSELSTDRIYTFLKGARLSIWSWTGCELQIEGQPGSLHKTKDSRVMTMYFNFHNCLEQHREVAVQQNTTGPRVLIVGAGGSGRSSLCRVLLNYAARMRGEDRRNPLFVDLDFVQPDLAVPGTLACCQFDRPADPMYDYYYHRKFVLPYGGTSPEDNAELLYAQIKRMGEVIDRRFANDDRARHSGLIINAFAWVKTHGYNHIFTIAKAFKVNFIVVLENDAMYGQLKNSPAELASLEKDLQIVQMPKARGLADRYPEDRRIHRESRVRINIYGHPLRSPKHVPFFHELDFADVALCKLGNPTVNALLLPAGADLTKVKVAATPIQPNTFMVNHVLYVTNVDSPDKVLSEGSVIGYLVVKKVDMATRKITVMTNFEILPKKVFLDTEIQFKE